MLELEVVPERSLGNEQWEFVLGMAFSQAVQILQQHATSIKKVQVLYSELNPLAMDLVINLSQDGIRLIFESKLQRLKVIEVYGMNRVKLKYCGIPFNSPEVTPTLEQIDHSFGATHPGVLDSVHQAFILNFRGLSFSFPVESKLQPQQTKDSNLLPKCPFPNGTSPTVSKMSIYSGNSLQDTRPPPLPLCCFYNHSYLERLEVLREDNRTQGVRLHLVTEGLGPGKLHELKKQNCVRVIRFGDSCQDICRALGSPSKIFYKAEDKMKIHSPHAHRLVTARKSDYFYNYFTLGLDILINAKTHCAKKFLLHTNYPGHYNFNMYFRCNMEIHLDENELRMREGESVGLMENSAEQTRLINTFTKWDSIKELLVSSRDKPVVLNRASTTNTINPFGPTLCYGYQDMIFEIMPNSHIASVTLTEQKQVSTGIRLR